jgi:hypothetical protein
VRLQLLQKYLFESPPTVPDDAAAPDADAPDADAPDADADVAADVAVFVR